MATRRKPAKRIGSQHASSGRSGSLGRSLGQVVVSQQRQREATTTWHILCGSQCTTTYLPFPLTLPPASSGSFQVYLLTTCPFCQQRLPLPPAPCLLPHSWPLPIDVDVVNGCRYARLFISVIWTGSLCFILWPLDDERQPALRIKDHIIASMCHQKEI